MPVIAIVQFWILDFGFFTTKLKLQT